MKKILMAAGILLCVASVGGTAYVITMADNEPPVIHIPEEEITYVNGQDYAALLEGVTAVDDKDGDVSASLLVENVFPSTDGKTAKAVCVALDHSNNVAKAERTVRYFENEGAEIPDPVPQTEETPESAATPEPVPTEEAKPEEEKAQTPETQTEPEQTQQETAEEEKPEEEPAPGAPKITLSMTEDTVKRGDDVQRLAYVKEITDDKDDRKSLYEDIQIKGEVDSSKAGTYELVYYVVDADGNKSNEAVLKITVE